MYAEGSIHQEFRDLSSPAVHRVQHSAMPWPFCWAHFQEEHHRWSDTIHDTEQSSTTGKCQAKGFRIRVLWRPTRQSDAIIPCIRSPLKGAVG